MTNYYFLASDQKLGAGNGSVEFTETEPYIIPGFDFPIQIEIFNGIEKDWELQELVQYIHRHTRPYEECTIQIAHLLNSNLEELSVQTKHTLLLHEIVDPKQLLLQEGHLLTVKKIPIGKI